MPSISMFALIAILVYAFVYAVVKLALSSKEFKSQPMEDQERARKIFRRAFIFLPFVLAGSYLLLLAPPSVVRALPLALYLSLWLFAAWLLWRSFRLGIKRDIRFVKAVSGKPLKDPESLLASFAIANLLLSLGVVAILLAIPILRLPLDLWAPLLSVVSATYAGFTWRVERKNAA
jgi:hypothetical protein